MAVQRGRSERRGESYSVPYVEPLSDARTKLADFFSILLGGNIRIGGRCALLLLIFQMCSLFIL
jgi:hypothetical protein